MPEERYTDMGITYKSYEFEKIQEKDEYLLALLLYYASPEVRNIVKQVLGDSYFQEKCRKAEKALVISRNQGLYDISTKRIIEF